MKRLDSDMGTGGWCTTQQDFHRGDTGVGDAEAGREKGTSKDSQVKQRSMFPGQRAMALHALFKMFQ